MELLGRVVVALHEEGRPPPAALHEVVASRLQGEREERAVKRSILTDLLAGLGTRTKETGGHAEVDRPQDAHMLDIAHKRHEDNLDSLIRQGKRGIFSTIVNVSPQMAEDMLARNLDNRPLRMKGSARSVEAYSAAMSRGEWLMNGEAVIVSREGYLNDGQHRLHAVVHSGVTIPMHVVFGVDRDSRHTVDQGAARTPGNILAMHGEKNTTQLATALQFVFCHDNMNRAFSYRPSPEQLLDTLDQNPGLRDAVRSIYALACEFNLSRGYTAGAFYVCGRKSAELASEFLDGVTTGLNVNDQTSPIYRLRKRYMEHALKRENLPSVEQAALFIKGFNAFRKGTPVHSLRWRRHGSASEDFPVVGR